MTAGRGVMHSRIPRASILREGGRAHGFRIRANLPACLKMTRPRYQEPAGSGIPEATSQDGLARVRIIAGGRRNRLCRQSMQDLLPGGVQRIDPGVQHARFVMNSEGGRRGGLIRPCQAGDDAVLGPGMSGGKVIPLPYTFSCRPQAPLPTHASAVPQGI